MAVLIIEPLPNMFKRVTLKNPLNFVPRKRAACKSVNGSHKYKGNSKDVKPPDLWIHHERLELKPIDKSPDPNPIMTDTPIPRNSQDITPVDNSMDSNIHQRRNSYRGAGFSQMLGDYFHFTHFPFYKVALIWCFLYEVRFKDGCVMGFGHHLMKNS